MATKKTETIALRKWILNGKKFDYIVVCPKCKETKKINQFQDLFFCQFCGLDLRVIPTKAGKFTIWKQQIIPVFPWSEPVKVIRKRKSKITRTKRSFDG